MSTYIRYPSSLSGGGLAIGIPVTSGTGGSVLFIDLSNDLAQDNSHFFYDGVNHFLGLGTPLPATQLHISDGTAVSSSLLSPSSTDKFLLSSTSTNIVDVVSCGSPVFRFIKSGGTVDVPTTVADTNSVFQIVGSAFDGTTRQSPINIKALINGTVSAGSVPTDLLFMAGTASAVERMRVKSDGTINIAGLNSAGVVHTDSSGNLSTSLVVNADVSASAAIAYSKLSLGTSIVNADISASAAIDYSKLAALTSAHILVGSAGNVATDVAVTGDVTISNAGVTAIGATKVTNAMLAGSIDLTAKVTGVLPIANGGTNLNAVGAAGKVLRSDGSVAAYSYLIVQTKTTTYTALQNDDVVLADASGGGWSLALPACATVGAGKKYFVKKTDSSANLVTIDPNSSETVDGAATFILSAQYDAVTLITDGSNWYVF